MDRHADPPGLSTEGNVVEVEFELGGGEFFLAKASEQAECEVSLKEVYQRSDGAVLEYLSVRGADPERVLQLARKSDIIEKARLLSATDEQALFEFISHSQIATALADRECRVTRIEATAGNGRVRAEVPPHVDASTVIAAFREEYPDASLALRRETDRRAPMFTESQLREQLLSELTDRQLQALRMAQATGYFEQPREKTASELAEELNLSAATFGQHLRAAERKVFNQLFEK